ncbi:MAG: hypothetical protein PWP24_852 [Clostridiales bacterium]|nr:hypothetical protein [Clostridiales bacterium]
MNYLLKIYDDCNETIKILLDKIIQKNRDKEIKKDLTNKALLYELIAKLTDYTREREVLNPSDSIVKMQEYIRSNLSQNLSIQELALQCNMNFRQFSYSMMC